MGAHYWRTAFFLSFFIGVFLVFPLFPLARKLAIVRPELLCLLLIFWVLNRPQQMGVTFAFGLGLFQDVIHGNVWGSHALALTVLAYICLLSWQRIRSYSVWQQAMWVFVLVGTHQVVVSWVQGFAGYPSPTKLIVFPALVSALLWPFFSWVMLQLQWRLRLGT